MHTHVAIIGAGPAGLTLATMLRRQGIDSVVLERHERDLVQTRTRAGVLEQPTVEVLHELGAGDRLTREGSRHRGFYLRFDGATHHLDFHSLVGGYATVYPQQKVLADLLALADADGADIRFGARVIGAEQSEGEVAVRYRTASGERTIRADHLACCDGAHGVGRILVPPRIRKETGRTTDTAWLGILARSTPVADEGMYAVHPEGMALHSMRGPDLTRQYLQVPADTDPQDWTDARIWATLRRRSSAEDAPPIETGEILERSLTVLQASVSTGMQHGRFFLLGDAAHIVPPTGAKGLNMAVADAATLAYALAGHRHAGDPRALADYTATCLPRIWQCQRFAATMTDTVHRLTDDPMDMPLRRARMTRWIESPRARAALGEAYLGLPFATPWRHPASPTPAGAHRPTVDRPGPLK